MFHLLPLKTWLYLSSSIFLAFFLSVSVTLLLTCNNLNEMPKYTWYIISLHSWPKHSGSSDIIGVCTDGNDQSWKPKCSQPWNYGEVELGSILSDCLQACLDLGWSIKWSQIMTPSYGPTYLLAHVTWRKSSLQENGMPERNPTY